MFRDSNFKQVQSSQGNGSLVTAGQEQSRPRAHQAEHRGRAISYAEYLASEHWQKLRAQKLSLNPNCESCNITTGIRHVHHLTYRRPLETVTVDDLMTLCEECHHRTHALIPMRYFSKRKPNRKKRAHVLKQLRGVGPTQPVKAKREHKPKPTAGKYHGLRGKALSRFLHEQIDSICAMFPPERATEALNEARKHGIPYGMFRKYFQPVWPKGNSNSQGAKTKKSGEGKPCKKCGKPMTRKAHADWWMPSVKQRIYFEYWDVCTPCKIVQHYKDAQRFASQRTVLSLSK